MVRLIEDSDLPMICRWHQAHTGRELPVNLLPPVGVLVINDGEPLGACWMYQAVGIGVAFINTPVTYPGLRVGEALDIITAAVDALEAIAKEHDYGWLICNAQPAIARIMTRSMGFTPVENITQLARRIN